MFFRTQHNVPDVYTNESRDFQLLEKICDVTFNTTLSNLNKVQFVRYVETIDAALLKPLASYLGFFTDAYYPEELLRSILMSFRDIIKHKGTLTGIELATTALQSAYSGISKFILEVDENDPCSITVISDGRVIDSTYVEEVLKYVVPVGVKVVQSYDKSLSTSVVQKFEGNAVHYRLNSDSTSYETTSTAVESVKKSVSTIETIQQ